MQTKIIKKRKSTKNKTSNVIHKNKEVNNKKIKNFCEKNNINNIINKQIKQISNNKNNEINPKINNDNREKIKIPNKFFDNIKSNYILKYIFETITEKRNLKIIRHNKCILQRLEIDINYYKKYKNRIEIDLIPISLNSIKNDKNIFINYNHIDNKHLYHIYFNNNRTESYRNYITKEDKIKKIHIIIESGIKSLEGLFENCKVIKKIIFMKYKRNDITNMSKIFANCSNLLFVDLSCINTYKVNNMS